MCASSTVDPNRLFQVYVNKNRQRIDAPLFKADSGAFKRLDEMKKKGQPPCNTHHILGAGTCTNPNCGYTHGELPQDEVLALAARNRQSLYKYGSNCMKPDCLYGHNCPHDPICDYGIRGGCRFDKYHGIDKQITHVLVLKGEERPKRQKAAHAD